MRRGFKSTYDVEDRSCCAYGIEIVGHKYRLLIVEVRNCTENMIDYLFINTSEGVSLSKWVLHCPC